MLYSGEPFESSIADPWPVHIGLIALRSDVCAGRVAHMEGLGSRSPGQVEMFVLTLLIPDLISKVEESQRRHQFRLIHSFISFNPQVLSIL